MTYYKQCAIQRKALTFLIWLPEQYAAKDKIVNIKMAKSWQRGWLVLRTFDVKLSEKEIKDVGEIYVLPDKIEESSN